MPQVMDVISKENVHSLHDAFVEGVLKLPRTKAGDLGLTQTTFRTVGVPIVRYVYTRLMASAVPNTTGSLGTYPHVSTQSVHAILFDEGVFHGKQKNRSTRLAADVARILSMSGIGHYVRSGGIWYLRPFDESKVEYFSSYDKKVMVVDARTEKRIEDEADKPVEIRYDLRTFKVPEGNNPDDYFDFITNFIPAAIQVQKERDEFRVNLDEANSLIMEMKQTIEEQAWRSVGSQIRDMLDS